MSDASRSTPPEELKRRNSSHPRGIVRGEAPTSAAAMEGSDGRRSCNGSFKPRRPDCIRLLTQPLSQPSVRIAFCRYTLIAFEHHRRSGGRDEMILGRSPLICISLAIQIALLFVNSTMSLPVQPEKTKKRISDAITALSALSTAFLFTIFPAKLPVVAVAAALLVASALPPCVGLLENRFRQHGEEIFAERRFPGHLTTNMLGAFAVAAFFWIGHSTNGFVAFTQKFSDASAFNVVLPLTTLVVFAFVRWQQVSECPNIDDIVVQQGEWDRLIRGSSLSSWHQRLNTFYLIIATFLGASTILYLFAFSVVQAKNGYPIDFSLQMGLAILAFLAFLFACGGPWSWNNRAVYFTFLTGTPGALVAALIWLILLRPSTARNVFAVTVVGVGYLLYCAGAILGGIAAKSGPEKAGHQTIYGEGVPGAAGTRDRIELHYFSAAVFAVALTVLIGALYLSQES